MFLLFLSLYFFDFINEDRSVFAISGPFLFLTNVQLVQPYVLCISIVRPIILTFSICLVIIAVDLAFILLVCVGPLTLSRSKPSVNVFPYTDCTLSRRPDFLIAAFCREYQLL